MKKIDYLKRALQSGLADRLAWIVSAFCLTREGPEDYTKDPYAYRLISAHNKYMFLHPDGRVEDIDDSSTKEPLFRFKDRLMVDNSWAGNIPEPVETGIGNLIFNAVCILPHFGIKYPFPNGKLKINDHQTYIAKILTDTPKEGEKRDQGRIYVDEYLAFRDSLVYLEQLAPITSWSATRKGITAPTGIKEFRKQLLEEYKGRLNDPTVFAEYEARLKAFDAEYLKDDPANGTFLSGKVKDISRKKMFLAIGIPERLDPKDPIVPITRTLEEGQPEDPVEYTASLNGARFGSYSRGTETINGGVVSKSVIRIGSFYKINIDDCGTTLGVRKVYTNDIIKTLVGRTIVSRGSSIKIENLEQAQNYLDKKIVVRSPAYCQAGPGDRLCRVCAGEALSQHEDGLIIPLTEVSHLILNQSLKAMHGSILSVADLQLENVLS